MVRRLLLFGVVLGVMSVSIHGQVSVTEPLLGFRFAVTLAVVLDVGALLALNEVLTTRRDEVRRWGWTALVLAAGLSVGLNVWHAVDSGTLPLVAAVAVGAIPVVLAGVLSHLLALALADEPEAVPVRPAGTTSRPVVRPAPGGTATGTGGVGRVVADRAGSGSAPGPRRSSGTGTPVPVASTPDAARPTGRVRPEAPVRPAPAGAAAVEELPAAARAVWDQARALDARHRADTGRAAPYTLLRGELGIGQSTVVPLYRALAVAAEPAGGTDRVGTAAVSTGTTGSPGTETERTDTGPVPPASTETDPHGATAGTADTRPVPAADTESRLTLVPATSTGADRPGTADHGPDDSRTGTDTTAMAGGR